MVKKAKHKSRRGKKALQRKRLTTKEKMDIVQYRDMGLSINQVANRVKCCYQTVEYTMKVWANDIANAENVRLARARALENMAGDFGEKLQLVMEHITPDSLTHDRVEVRDAKGNLTAVNHSGPTALQNVTALGILVDKMSKVQERADVLRMGNLTKETEARSADDIAALISGIQDRAAKMSITIDVDNLARVGNGVEEAAYVEIEEPSGDKPSEVLPAIGGLLDLDDEEDE